MNVRTLQAEDVAAMWRVNEEGLPGVGKVSTEAMADLLRLSELPLGAFDGTKLEGFVLCLLPRTQYGSPNYAWFNERYSDFLYVDRIAVAHSHRNQGIGALLYERVIEAAALRAHPIAAEVSLDPPNPGSMRFHGRHNFATVGTLDHGHQSVTMLMRPADGPA
jgi:predicted GNAT superfamily acetyltransferase